ncbi:integral membrane family protein [Lentinula edodes]|uniref:Integral membrane family protein n=1 Tax=Lentinula edodes TaxID=5353 RepID=A0A1Q3EQ92_LENED|nr:integral membrane family protein [Lentinula edodes]
MFKLESVPIISLLFATLLSAHGLRKKSLSPGGAATAFIVGLLMMAGGVKVFGVSLIVFYLTGSRATKLGKQRKAQLEDGYHEAGYRSGWQVLSNSFAAFVACVLWNILFSQGSLQTSLILVFGTEFRDGLINILGLESQGLPEYGDGGSWCPVDQQIAGGWSRLFIFATLGHFGCCLGDTLASELGILSPSKPVLITSLKPVPPGTNGGMSVGGTCRADWMSLLPTMIFWGAMAGGTGSLLDSFLGATVQQTKFSESKKLILQDNSTPTGSLKVISGMNILTNNQVNVVSSIFTSIWMSLV